MPSPQSDAPHDRYMCLPLSPRDNVTVISLGDREGSMVFLQYQEGNVRFPERAIVAKMNSTVYILIIAAHFPEDEKRERLQRALTNLGISQEDITYQFPLA